MRIKAEANQKQHTQQTQHSKSDSTLKKHESGGVKRDRAQKSNSKAKGKTRGEIIVSLGKGKAGKGKNRVGSFLGNEKKKRSTLPIW